MEQGTRFLDEAFSATTFVVIDFEGTTPKGRRPEPIEVAALALSASTGRLTEAWRFDALIRPPSHAPVTAFDSVQTGITAAMVADQPPASVVLAELNARLTAPPYVLVAHNAPTEAGLIFDYREACPVLSHIDLIDTVRLSRAAYPQLSSYRLDVLLDHLSIPHPPNRHRAMPDVEVTALLFARLIEDGACTGRWRSLQHLQALGGFTAKAKRPQQESLFDQ